ncbi:MAG: hypothetical protein HZB29_03475 [Nitrospinae bacterium]|nr:hypothetical protein [Nitrospinota bacterium]
MHSNFNAVGTQGASNAIHIKRNAAPQQAPQQALAGNDPDRDGDNEKSEGAGTIRKESMRGVGKGWSLNVSA